MQPALPNVVRRRFSGLSAGPLLTAILCGLQGRGITLGGWSEALLGLWPSPFLWRGTAAPSDRTLTLREITYLIHLISSSFLKQNTYTVN